MTTTKKTVVNVRKDVEDLGHNLQTLGKKLLGDATNATLNVAEKALVTAQKQLQKVRAQLNRPGQ